MCVGAGLNPGSSDSLPFSVKTGDLAGFDAEWPLDGRLQEDIGDGSESGEVNRLASVLQEPPPLEIGQLQGVVFGNTKLCKFWSKGVCTRGTSCSFAHSRAQLRALPDLFKTEMCFQFNATGVCQYGNVCKYAHREDEIRSPLEPKACLEKKWSVPGKKPRVGELETLRSDAKKWKARICSFEKAVTFRDGIKTPGLQIEAGEVSLAPQKSQGTSESEAATAEASGSNLSADTWSDDVKVSLVVKNSFLMLVPLERTSSRRTASALAACRSRH